MESREKIIKEYFNCWINKDVSILEKVFHRNARYLECYGPAYDGLVQIKSWFNDWQVHGKVFIWEINEFVHNKENCICDWYFKCEYDDKFGEFNGVTWIKFSNENKIIELREYQSKVPNYYPYDNK